MHYNFYCIVQIYELIVNNLFIYKKTYDLYHLCNFKCIQIMYNVKNMSWMLKLMSTYKNDNKITIKFNFIISCLAFLIPT